MTLPDSTFVITKGNTPNSSLTVRTRDSTANTEVKYINYFLVTVPGEITIQETPAIPTTLMWDFRNGNMAEQTYSDLAFTVHSGGISNDANGIQSTASNTEIRLYNTNNLLYNTLTNGGFLRDVKINIEIETPGDYIMPFVFRGYHQDGVDPFKTVLASMVFYNESTSFAMLRGPDTSDYQFLFDWSTTQFTREDWGSLTKWSWSLVSDPEPDSNEVDTYNIYRNDILVQSGQTKPYPAKNASNAEVGMYFPNDPGAYLEIKLPIIGGRINYFSLEKTS